MSQNFATDYVDVAARLIAFREAHPEGSLQPVDPLEPFRVMEIGGKTRIVYAAAAYRSPDDPRPGIGVAYEEVPGRTPYTRDSELQNAETSAWGRAIVAALAADTKKGIASAEEVRNRQADRDVQVERPRPAAKKAERGPLPPEQDPWAGVDVKRPPVVTDQAWAKEWSAKVAGCDAIPTLRGLFDDLAAQVKAGKVSEPDATDLRALIEEQAADLTKAAERVAS